MPSCCASSFSHGLAFISSKPERTITFTSSPPMRLDVRQQSIAVLPPPRTITRLPTFVVCPKETEGAFLAGLEKGRGYRPNPPQAWPYYERMSQLEKQIIATPSEAAREPLKVQLREAEWWAIHIDTCSCSYTSSGRN